MPEIRGSLRFRVRIPHPDGMKSLPCFGQSSPLDATEEKDVCKVRRINNRWIVHGGLRENANAFLDHLETVDPHRLATCCAVAMALVHRRHSVVDPKPRFYAGLFSLATPAEVHRYLAAHPLTRAISLLLDGDASGLDSLPESARPIAAPIANEIRDILAHHSPSL